MAIAPSPGVPGPVEDFEARTWRDALGNFQQNSGHKEAMDEFLKKTSTPATIQQTCRDKQREAGAQYGKILSKIIGKIDIFIQVGNVAVKGAPESVGLAWTGIQMALHSVQDDFATFQLFSGACVDIIGILITCRLFGRMFSEKDGPPELQEIQDQVLDAIPKVYGNILEFSYRMYKVMGTSGIIRITKGLFTAQKSKFQGLIDGVKAGEVSMSEYATKASQALGLWYAKKSDATQDKMLADLAFIKETIDDNARSSRELADFVRKELEASRKRTPMDVARDAFHAYKRQLKMIDHTPQLDKRKELREPGTCTWVPEAKEYKQWRNAEGDTFLWMSGGGNMGKSFLVASVIELLQEEAKKDQDMIVQYFFCKNGDNDAQKSDRILAQILGWLYDATPPTLETMDRCNEIVRRFLQKPASGATAGKGSDKEVEGGDKGMPFEEAYAALAAALKKKVFLVVDALDEISDRQDQETIQTLLKVHTQPTAQKNIKIFVSSRPETDIVDLLGETLRIRVEKYNEEDIKRAVTNQVDQIPGMSPSERAEASKTISERAGPYFGYVNPALALLRQPWQRPLKQYLKQLPKNVYDMNLKILAETDPRYLGFLKTCMTWTIFAAGNQKVTIDEVVDAYSKVYSVDDLDWTREEITDEAQIEFYRKQIQDAGDAFLDVNEKTKELSLIKPAIVKDSFVRKDDESEAVDHDPTTCEECKARKRAEKVFVLTEKSGHLEMARTIFEHLNSSSFARHYLPWEEPPEEADKTEGEGWGKAETAESGKLNRTAAENDQTADTRAGGGGLKPNGDVKDGGEATDAASAQEEKVAVNGTERSEPSAVPNTNGDSTEATGSAIVDGEQQDAPEATTNGTEEASPVTTPPADAEEKVEEPAEDDDLQSEADSDIEPTDWGRDFPPLDESTAEHTRYEILQCIHHLQEAEAKWSTEDKPLSQEYEALLVEAAKFFTADNPAYKAWKKQVYPDSKLGLAWDESSLGKLMPVHIAAHFGLYDLAKRIVARGDDIEAKSTWGKRALHGAAQLPLTSPTKYKLCKFLLEKGADPNGEGTSRVQEGETWDSTKHGWCEPPYLSLLYYGCDKELLQLFLDHGADPGSRDVWGLTALHNFGFVGTDRAVLALLFEKGVDIKAVDDRGETALHKLLDRREFPIEILEDFIKAGAEINKDNIESAQPLFEVASNGNVEAAKLMLDNGADITDDNDQGWTALHAAASAGDEKMTALLVERGADIMKGDKRGRTPFFLACESGEITTARYLAKLLSVKDPSLLDKASDNGKTPFRKAAAKSHTEVARMLLTELETQVNMDATDTKMGRTALHWAAYNGSDQVLGLLLEHGARADILDKRGDSALRLCYMNWGVRAAHDPNNEGFEKCLVRLIDLERHAAVTDPDLVSTATRKGSLTLLKHLLENEPRADPNNRDQDGWSAIEIARQYRQPDAEKVLNERGAVVGRYPSKWVSSSSKRIAVDEEEGTSASFVFTQEGESRFTVLSDRPIPAGLKRYYYEATISVPEKEGDDGHTTEVVIGISHREFAAKTFLGWLPGHARRHMTGSSSWGYHGDDGVVRTSTSIWERERDRFEQFGDGDTIGCGVDFEKGTVFWTKNGKRLMNKAFDGVSGRLHPAFGASSKCSIETNFSNRDFLWKPGNSLDFDSDVPALVRSKTMRSMDG